MKTTQTHRSSLIRVLLSFGALAALVLTTVVSVAPAAAAPPDGTSANPRAARLGGSRASFEQRYGAMDDTCGGQDLCQMFYPGGDAYPVVQVTFLKGKVAAILVPAAGTWTIETALQAASAFLPTDVNVSRSQVVPISHGNWALNCHSASLEQAFSRASYAAMSAYGEPGDCRVIFGAGTGWTISTVLIRLGDGQAATPPDLGSTPLTVQETTFLQDLMTRVNGLEQSQADYQKGLDTKDRALVLDAISYWVRAYEEAQRLAAPTARLASLQQHYLGSVEKLDQAAAGIQQVVATGNAQGEGVRQSLQQRQQGADLVNLLGDKLTALLVA